MLLDTIASGLKCHERPLNLRDILPETRSREGTFSTETHQVVIPLKSRKFQWYNHLVQRFFRGNLNGWYHGFHWVRFPLCLGRLTALLHIREEERITRSRHPCCLAKQCYQYILSVTRVPGLIVVALNDLLCASQPRPPTDSSYLDFSSVWASLSIFSMHLSATTFVQRWKLFWEQRCLYPCLL